MNIHKTRAPKRLMILAVALTAGVLAAPEIRADDQANNATTAESNKSTTRPVEVHDLIVSGLDSDGKLTLPVNGTRVVVMRNSVKWINSSVPDESVGVSVVDNTQGTEYVVTGRKPGSSQIVWADVDGNSQTIQVHVTPDLSILQEQLKKLFPGAKIEVSASEGAIVLRGHVPDAEKAQQAVQVAGASGAKVLNFLEVAGGRQVTLQVRFAEVSRDATTNLGFNAFGSGGPTKFGNFNGPGDTPAGSGLSSATASIDPTVTLFGAGKAGTMAFEFFIDALRQNNLLRVLAEPNLTVMSGKSADFLAGGEFPIPVPQANGSGGSAITIEYKQFGVRLSFTPIVLGDGRIRLQVSPEVSDLDFTQSVSFNGFVIPSLTKRSATTIVELNEGQTLAMAGLLNNRVNASSNVTPLLGDLPIIGMLFRSVRYQRTETELVVMVTPKLAGGMNPGQVPDLPGEHWRYPSEPELLLNRDLGGPVVDSSRAPTASAPRRFQGAYGFAPATPNAK